LVEFNDTTIISINERINELERPNIANVDQAIIITSAVEPDISYVLLDKLLAHIIHKNIKPIIVVTKTDIALDSELKSIKNELSYYGQFLDVYYTSSKQPDSYNTIREIFKDKITVLSGQSGAGKSSFLNTLNPNLNLNTNDISKALGRGKHTTRHTELFFVNEGWIADTPGFSKLSFDTFSKEQLESTYFDFNEQKVHCHFKNCIHVNEPKCGVKQALGTSIPYDNRYKRYIQFIHEINSQKRKY
jgi:ribosome biogenesis GTPase